MARLKPDQWKTKFTPAKICSCGCQRILAFPRLFADLPGRVGVYLRSWDGNPFYDPKLHRRHPRGKYLQFLKETESPPLNGPPLILLEKPR